MEGDDVNTGITITEAKSLRMLNKSLEKRVKDADQRVLEVEAEKTKYMNAIQSIQQKSIDMEAKYVQYRKDAEMKLVNAEQGLVELQYRINTSETDLKEKQLQLDQLQTGI